MGAKGCDLETGELVGEKAGQREYPVTGVALENGLPNFPCNHVQHYCLLCRKYNKKFPSVAPQFQWRRQNHSRASNNLGGDATV